MTPTRSTLLHALSLCVALAACGTDVAVGSRDGSVDAGPGADSGTSDSGVVSDAAADGGADSGPDAGSPTPCATSADCATGTYCHTPIAACAATGRCDPFDPTVACDVVPDLVCGCDGHTYDNTCAAVRAGVSVDHADACPPWTDGCISDLDCTGGEFCEFALGECHGSGTCTSRGIRFLCADVCDPECGCDGTSYQNPCLRRKAAVSLQQAGTCPGGPPPCTVGGSCCSTRVDCPVGQECVGAVGPTPTGKCLPTGPVPSCWVDIDCPLGQTCSGAFVCPCGMTCPRPDAAGSCA